MSPKTTTESPPLSEILNLANEFLRKCFELEPQLKESLIGEVAPLGPPDEIFEKPSDEYFLALQNWAERYRICCDWVLDAVTRGLYNWKKGYINVPFFVAGSRISPFSREETCFRFEHPGWDPVMDSEEKGIEIVRNAFLLELDRYCERLRKKAGELGFSSMPKQIVRESYPSERIEWLVRHLVQDWSAKKIIMIYDRIADKKFRAQLKKKQQSKPTKRNSKQIRAATNKLAGILGLKTYWRHGRPREK